MPYYVFAMIMKRASTRLSLAGRLGRMPESWEIDDCLGLPPGKARLLWCALKVFRELDGVDSVPSDPDEPKDEDLVNALRDLPDAVASLGPRQRKVIRRRFGFGCEPETLEEIGSSLGVSREAVRQIEVRGLRKMYKLLVKREVGGAKNNGG